jgi:hypothetical protein
MSSVLRAGLMGTTPGSVWVGSSHPAVVPSPVSFPAHKAVMR